MSIRPSTWHPFGRTIWAAAEQACASCVGRRSSSRKLYPSVVFYVGVRSQAAQHGRRQAPLDWREANAAQRGRRNVDLEQDARDAAARQIKQRQCVPHQPSHCCSCRPPVPRRPDSALWRAGGGRTGWCRCRSGSTASSLMRGATGATISIANPAARAAFGLAADDPDCRPTAPFAAPPAVPPAPPLRPRPDRPGTRADYCAGPISFWAK